MKSRKIVVLAGGRSDEREVSLRSGRGCHEALRRKGHASRLIDFKGPADVETLLKDKPDGVLLLLHGAYGEDGCIQGLLEWTGIPYSGSDVAASSLGMDKFLSKLNWSSAGLPCAPGELFDEKLDFGALCRKWECDALFMKPRCGGSSCGARIVDTEQQWLELGERETGYLVEPYVRGREFTIGLLQGGDGWQALPLLELRPKGRFYDYESKYTPGGTELICPARIDEDLAQRIKDLGVAAVKRAGARGYARIDVLLSSSGPLILEINTLPGMTETSDLPAMAAAAGIGYDELVEILLPEVIKGA